MSRFARAFSLIEVLIAVLILGLGLLGLGALFPVVVREQRLGTEATYGVLAAQSARDTMEVLTSTSNVVPQPNGKSLWQNLRDLAPPVNPDGATAADTYLPVPGTLPNSKRGAWKAVELEDASTGTIRIGREINNRSMPLLLPVKERLYPRDMSDGAQPQFVWDLAIQRVPDYDTNPFQASAINGYRNDALRFAIFVRRIDPRIRLAAGTNGPTGQPLTLYDALTERGGIGTANWRVPVAEDTNGLPTQDGLGVQGAPRYCPPKVMDIEYLFDANDADFAFRDRLYVPTAVLGDADDARALWAYARQPNQKLIDNLGNLYTVIESGVNAPGRQYVRVVPPIPHNVIPTGVNQNANSWKPQIREVVFTQQVPASVMLWTVNP